MRLFIALPLPPEIERELGNYIDQLKKGGGDVKWVKPTSIHLTLKFLGETDEALIASTSQAISDISTRHTTINTSINSLGAFPNLKRPRVFWVGLENNLDKMAALASEIDERVSAFGFEKEKRAFKPHLTLGRVKNNKAIDQTVKIMEKIAINKSDFACDRIILFKSTLTPQGAIYDRLHEAQLGVVRFGD